MRFSLLCASTALAASLMLAACSSGGGSSSAIPGGSSIAPMGQSHGGYRLVTVAQRDTTCPSSFVQCLAVSPGSYASTEWCLSSSGNCTSGLYAGRVKWTVPEQPIKNQHRPTVPQAPRKLEPGQGQPERPDGYRGSGGSVEQRRGRLFHDLGSLRAVRKPQGHLLRPRVGRHCRTLVRSILKTQTDQRGPASAGPLLLVVADDAGRFAAHQRCTLDAHPIR